MQTQFDIGDLVYVAYTVQEINVGIDREPTYKLKSVRLDAEMYVDSIYRKEVEIRRAAK